MLCRVDNPNKTRNSARHESSWIHVQRERAPILTPSFSRGSWLVAAVISHKAITRRRRKMKR